MKTSLLAAVVSSGLLTSSFASPPPVEGRTVKDVSEVIPLQILQRSVSPQFYKSLRVSPIKGWIVVKGQLAGTHLSGARVVRSSLGGAYDLLALKLADQVRIAGAFSVGQSNPTHNVMMHLLIYKIADGTMALSFAHLDHPGAEQMKYFGCARLMVQQSDGRWADIKGPTSLQGQGWAVRDSGGRNDLESTLKVESVFHDTPPRQAFYHEESHRY